MPLQGFGGDLRVAARRLLATPQFFAFAVLSLAIGIGVTTAVYSILNSLSKPLAVAEPDRTVFVASPTQQRARLSLPDFDDINAAQHCFQHLAASITFDQALATPSRSELIVGEAVSGDYFATLGIRTRLGRPLQQADDADRLAVIVLSERLWRKRFDSDPAIIGKGLRLGGQTFDVVGIAAAGFDGLSETLLRSGAWVPLSAMSRFENGRAPAGSPRDWAHLDVVGLLRPAATVAGATAELQTLAGRFDTAFPLHSGARGDARLSRRWSARLVNRRERTPQDRAGTVVFVGLIGLVLVVACLNLANLMLARGTVRQREFAVRRALGASRWRLIRELTAESAMIAIVGGALGLLLIRAILAFATIDIPLPNGELSIEPHLDGPSLLAALTALLLSLVVFGIEPALQLTRGSVRGDLSGGDTAVGVPRSGRQRAFIRWQVAISATFLLIAAILAKVVVTELRHDSGVDLDRLSVAVVPLARTWEPERSHRVLFAAAEQLRQERTLESVAISSGVPFGMSATPFANLATLERPFTPGRSGEFEYFLSSTPQIFRTLGVRILHGRGFEDRDDAAAAPVMVVSEKAARDLFGAADPIGQRVLARNWGRSPDLPFTIVGIASDTDAQYLTGRQTGVVYVPMAQHFEPRVSVILARTSAPAVGARIIQNTLRQIEPDLAVANAGAASLVLAGAHVLARVAALLATTLGLLTLLLAMVGLYGIQSHIAAQRTREVGVRMALGAAARQIQGMMLRDGFRPVLEGVVMGLVFGALCRTVIRAYINAQVTPIDPVAFAIVPIPLVLAALIACYAPARRASRVDPNEALRHL